MIENKDVIVWSVVVMDVLRDMIIIDHLIDDFRLDNPLVPASVFFSV